MRRSGFTLSELLVAMLCSSLILAVLLSAVIFVLDRRERILSEGEVLTEVEALEEYIRQKGLFRAEELTVSKNGDILHNGELLLRESGISSVRTEVLSNGFVRWEITADEDVFRFTVRSQSAALSLRGCLQ